MNSLLLAVYDYNDRDATTSWNQFLDYFGYFFTFAFTVEAAMKIIGKGFYFHSKSYLKESNWNILDFIIVLGGFAEFFAGTLNLKSLRTIRMLRPLKTINTIPSMRRLVKTLL